MKYFLAFSVLLMLGFGVSSMAAPVLEGESALILASIVNDTGMLSQTAWGKSQAGDMAKFFHGVFESKNCGDNAFKSLDIRVQANIVRCTKGTELNSGSCMVQSRDNKSKTETGKNAYILTTILKTIPGVQMKGNEVSVRSLDCTLAGWQVCKGIAKCSFPN